MTKFLISGPVSAPVVPPEGAIAPIPLKQSRWPADVPVAVPAMSVPLIDEVIHLDFGTNAPGTS